jgi:endo-alpha-1,4-polygalactosaminidase (GH114 family)
MGRRVVFKGSSSFMVYYGKDNVEELSKHDVAIVEPLGQSQENIEAIKEKGTLVIAYISVMEIQNCSEVFNLLKKEDFLIVKEEKLKNKDFDTYLIDLRSSRWRSILLHSIGNLIYNHNYDGIFLDTIGDLEFEIIPQELQNSLLSSAVSFIKDIRDTFEDIVIIQNNGLEKLCSLTGALVDGICWENPPVNNKASKLWVESVTNELRFLMKTTEVNILLLTDKEDKTAVKEQSVKHLAEENGFLFYSAPKMYL